MPAGEQPAVGKPEPTRRLMRFDHAVIFVTDLERATADYRALGFTVTPGGVHSGGATRNALVAFADGTYLELLTFTQRTRARLQALLSQVGMGGLLGSAKTPMEERVRSRATNGEGLIDYAVLPASLDAGLTRLQREGVRAVGPVEGGRSMPEGESIKWQLVFPVARELPFLCFDETPHDLRVPGGPAREHANGATGIAGIMVAVESLETSSARFRALTGTEPEPAPTDLVAGGRGRVFSLEGAEIVVATAAPAGHPVRQHLRRRGEGPFSIRLRCETVPEPRVLSPTRTHGVLLELAR